MKTAEESLADATRLLRQADEMCQKMEVLETTLLTQFDRLMHAVAKLEIERNAWRFLAQELEKERALWQTRAIARGYHEV